MQGGLCCHAYELKVSAVPIAPLQGCSSAEGAEAQEQAGETSSEEEEEQWQQDSGSKGDRARAEPMAFVSGVPPSVAAALKSKDRLTDTVKGARANRGSWIACVSLCGGWDACLRLQRALCFVTPACNSCCSKDGATSR